MLGVLLLILAVLVFILGLVDYFIRNGKSYKLAKSMNGPKMLPYVGCVEFLGLGQEESFTLARKNASLYPNGFRYWTFGIFSYNIYSADSVQSVAQNPKHSDKSFSYDLLRAFLGTGLLTSSGEKWFKRRKLLTPAFHFSILRNFHITFREQSALFIKTIREKELNSSNGTNLQKYLSRFTLNSVVESAMGVKLTRLDEMDSYRNQIYEIGKHHIQRFIIPWLIPDFTYKLLGYSKEEHKIVDKIHAFTGKIIQDRHKKFFESPDISLDIFKDIGNENEDSDLITLYKPTGKRQLAMLDALLWAEYNGNQIDIQGIQEEVDTFVFEGYDTTMTALTFILFMIAHHQDIQEKLFEEITQLDWDEDGSIDIRQYGKLKYLDNVIKESLRLYPAVPFIGRELGEDTEIDGVLFPARTCVHILIYDLHRDPKYFPNPEVFDPDRFTYENSINRHPFAYVPFSAGQRNCIGQKFAMLEIKTLVCEILLSFQLKPITNVEDLVFISDLILRTKAPIRIQFQERSATR